MNFWIRALSLSAALLASFAFIHQGTASADAHAADGDSLKYPQEKHLKNLRMLTFEGENAEAYWSFDNKQLVFQRTNPEQGIPCDRIYRWDVSGKNMESNPPVQVSNGEGRTTCSYFMPGNESIIFASTQAGGKECPEAPERTKGAYYWPIYDTYDIYVTDLNGKVLKRLTDRKGYDAEPTVSPKGDKIVFTSDRSGDLELWTMDLDGGNLNQVTYGLGYDGGAFFSPDGSQLVFRSSRPKTPEAIKEYKELLAKGLVKPSDMEIYVCNVDGSNLRQITDLGRANWAPFFHPSGEKILFSSNHASERIYQFNLWMINLDGSGLERITYDPVFDAFPMFSFDGKKLVFSSNRHNGGTRSTNIFIADWVD